MKIGVIGGGSIGLLLSSYLSRKHEVTIYVRRNEQKKVLNHQGLFLSDIPTPSSVQASLLEEIEKADCFIVCVKQNQIENVLSMIKKVNNNIPLLFIQNGMGHIKHLQEINNDTYIGVVEHGALRKKDNYVSHTGKGTIKMATYDGNNKKLIDLTKQLSLPEFPFEIAPDWKYLLTQKLMINAVINPLTTLFDVSNKEILSNAHLFYLAQKLCDEAAKVLQLDYDMALEKVKEIAFQTGDNLSSMLIDIKSGRQTEIEAISGYLLEKSNDEIPYTTFVYNSVKALEVKNKLDRSYG